ncbi:hypothetical protein D3C85_874450 [compost metagenome]
MNLDTTLGRLLGVTPGNRVVTSGGAIHMPQACEYWDMSWIEIQRWHQLPNLLTIDHLGAATKVLIDLGTLTERAHRCIGVRQG